MNTAISEETLARKFLLEKEEHTIRMARNLAPLMNLVSLVTLTGNLGAGKTTFARALIQALGYEGTVKSPTYTLVETYGASSREIFHFDLYRLADPEELEYLGLDDYFLPDALCLVEWADKGEGMLPPSDIDIELLTEGEGRCLQIKAISQKGRKFIEAIDIP